MPTPIKVLIADDDPDVGILLKSALERRGPFTVESALALLREHRIDVLVTKDSGGDDVKLVATRRLGVPVVIVRRPPSPAETVVSTVEQAANWVIY